MCLCFKVLLGFVSILKLESPITHISMMKRSSFSYKMRQSLSDITNSQSQEELNLNKIGSESSEHINRLMKENIALVKLLEERDKTIELSRDELRNLREGIHKLQVQNLSLAQSNSQFLGEINLARNKVKALHHEVTCKNALLMAKCCEQEEKGVNTQQRNALTTENTLTPSQRPFVPNSRRFIRSKSLGASIAHKIETEKEKSETKRRQLRRRSARVRSAAHEVIDNLFEIEDLQLTMPPIDMCLQDNLTMASHTRKKEEEEEDCKVHGSPVDQPLRREAEKMDRFVSVLR